MQTIYKMMLTDQKENLHEICATWYEKHHPNSATYNSVIMHHWMRSGNTCKKVRAHTTGSPDVGERNFFRLGTIFLPFETIKNVHPPHRPKPQTQN